MAPLATQNKATIFMTGKPGLRESRPIFRSVGQPDGGAIQGLESSALQPGCHGRPRESRLSDVDVNALRQPREDPLARLAIGRVVFIDRAPLQREKHGDLFHYFPARRVALKDLPQPTPKGAA
jgi:hypothetical protein